MIFAVVGPSGAGKDTLIAGALAVQPSLRLVRRVITRPTAAGGEPFESVTTAQFADRLTRAEFAFHWEAHGLRYGITKAQLASPGDVVFNGSREALPQAVRVFPDLRVILITAPETILATRLAARGRETPGDISARLERASFAMPAGIAFSTVVNDGSPATGVACLLAALYPPKG